MEKESADPMVSRLRLGVFLIGTVEQEPFSQNIEDDGDMR